MSTFKEHKSSADRSASDRRRHRDKIEKAIKDGIHNIVAEESIIGQDGKKKIGVQITPLKELLDSYKGSGVVIVRQVHSNLFTDENLKKVHDVVYGKPYDLNPIDWVEAFLKKDLNPQKTSRFWCSALCAFIYTKCGLLDPN